MRRPKRLTAAALALAALLALAGCSLARPQAGEASDGQPDQERFAGLYLVYSQSGDRNDFYDNPNLVEMGSDTLKAQGLGDISIPRQVLLARREGKWDWTFPGLEGFALYYTETLQEDGTPTLGMVSDMGEGRYHVTSADEGTTNDMSGVIYLGPPEGAPEDWASYDMEGIWTAYRVCLTRDGVPYLDGSGNSYSGGTFGCQTEESWRSTINGETEQVTVKVSVQLEEVPRLGQITLYQYGEGGQLLDAREISLDGTDQRAAWVEGACWAAVEETDIWGRSTRACYDRPDAGEEESVFHPFVLLDPQGVGRQVQLELTEQDREEPGQP